MKTEKKESDKRIRMKCHIIFTTRFRLHKLENEKLKRATEQAVRQACADNEAIVLLYETGIRDKQGKLHHETSSIHIYVHLHGKTGPEELMKHIRQACSKTAAAVSPEEKHSIWTRDYYIADDTQYDQNEALEFAHQRLAKYKEALRNEEL